MDHCPPPLPSSFFLLLFSSFSFPRLLGKSFFGSPKHCRASHVVLQDLDAPQCALKARAIAADPDRKLDAAKAKYLDAVAFVEGDSIGDPDLDRRAR